MTNSTVRALPWRGSVALRTHKNHEQAEKDGHNCGGLMETIKNITTGKSNLSEPDTSGLLSDSQLEDFGLIILSIFKIWDDITALNEVIRENGAPIRLVPTDSLALVENDISIAVRKHMQAENRIKEAAFAAVNREAA